MVTACLCNKLHLLKQEGGKNEVLCVWDVSSKGDVDIKGDSESDYGYSEEEFELDSEDDQMEEEDHSMVNGGYSDDSFDSDDEDDSE